MGWSHDFCQACDSVMLFVLKSQLPFYSHPLPKACEQQSFSKLTHFPKTRLKEESVAQIPTAGTDINEEGCLILVNGTHSFLQKWWLSSCPLMPGWESAPWVAGPSYFSREMRNLDFLPGNSSIFKMVTLFQNKRGKKKALFRPNTPAMVHGLPLPRGSPVWDSCLVGHWEWPSQPGLWTGVLSAAAPPSAVHTPLPETIRMPSAWGAKGSVAGLNTAMQREDTKAPTRSKKKLISIIIPYK